jgi:prepilin-type N-terminal cleavage/methylation domain-containing protein/prepilin-type processing-associated H-X9-DG protein
MFTPGRPGKQYFPVCGKPKGASETVSLPIIFNNCLALFPRSGKIHPLSKANVYSPTNSAGRLWKRLPSTGQRLGRAFTLIELLVVITIISLLAAILLPTLVKAKEQAKTIVCLGNLKQLQLCWHMYADDYAGVLAPNDDITVDGNGATANMDQTSWCEGQARFDTNTLNIQAGRLFPYNRSTAIYHCPSDISTIQDASGNLLPLLRTRSYNMSQSVNGLGTLPDPYNGGLPVSFFQPCFLKSADIRNPPPVQAFVFIDENEGTLWDAQFGYPMPNYDPGVWWDMPANRHDQGANLSFADGHVENWHWRVPMIYTLPPGGIGQPVPPEQMFDYNRVGNAMLIVPIDWSLF